jgi:hypothetical protein
VKWLKALFSETIVSVWLILSAFSTLSTFFFRNWSGKPRLISLASAIIGFAFANYRVFQKQEARVLALEEANRSRDDRSAQLRIMADNGSRYILRPVSNVPQGNFNAMFLEFHLMIENAGRRNSAVNGFQVEVRELKQTFNLKPEEGRHGVQGRHCVQGLNPNSVLSKTGILRVDAEKTTDHGTLVFFISGVSLETFAGAGLHMTGGDRKFPPLHCRLTLTDTAGSTATAEFELHEQ